MCLIFTSWPFQPMADLPRGGGVKKALHQWSNRWDSNQGLLVHSQMLYHLATSHSHGIHYLVYRGNHAWKCKVKMCALGLFSPPCPIHVLGYTSTSPYMQFRAARSLWTNLFSARYSIPSAIPMHIWTRTCRSTPWTGKTARTVLHVVRILTKNEQNWKWDSCMHYRITNLRLQPQNAKAARCT